MKANKSGKLLDYINATASASSEDDVDVLLQIMNPTSDREEMGIVYQEALGYNPVDYFDEMVLRTRFEATALTAPTVIATLLNNSVDNIINSALNHAKNENDMQLSISLALAIEEATGWMPASIEGVEVTVSHPKSESVEFTLDEDENYDEETDDEDDDIDEDEGAYIGNGDDDDDL